MPKILKAIFVILLLVTVGEIGYYVYFQYYQTKTVSERPIPQIAYPINDQKNPAMQAKTELLKNPLLTPLSCCFYDPDGNKPYAKVFLNDFMAKKDKMVADYNSWVALVSYNKEETEGLTVESQVKGKILEFNSNADVYGKSGIQIKLASMVYVFSKDQLAKVEVAKLVGGKESAGSLSDLEKDKNISVNLKYDLTKPDSDDNSLIRAKIVIL